MKRLILTLFHSSEYPLHTCVKFLSMHSCATLKCFYFSLNICPCHVSRWHLHSYTSEQTKPSGSSGTMGSLFPSLPFSVSLPVGINLERGRLKCFTMFFARQHRYLLVSVLEGVKQYCTSAVCLCRRKETILLCGAQGNFKCCSERVETEIIVAGDCARSGHLQQMCSSAPQPKDIPFVFRALAVVAGRWPAVWTVGCHLWKVFLGAWVQIRLIEEQRLRVLE